MYFFSYELPNFANNGSGGEAFPESVPAGI